MFNLELITLRAIFERNGCPEDFIDECFKFFLNIICMLKKKGSDSWQEASAIADYFRKLK